jgi:dCMP deaminase
MKREGYISWDEFGMSVALVAAQRSKDPSTQVGACILDSENRVVGVGYNGFPKGCSDDTFPWEKNKKFLDSKYAYVVHSEINAVLNSNVEDLSNCIIYVTLAPCNECSKVIIQSGIREVCYFSDKYNNTDSHKAARKMLDAAGIECRKFISARDNILLNFIEEKND